MFDIDVSTPDALAKSMQIALAKIQGEALSVSEPNQAKVAAEIKRLDETVAAAHKHAVDNAEKLALLEKARPEIDRNLDARMFRSFTLNHQVRHLNFTDGDNWEKNAFSSSDPAESLGRLLQFNLLVCDRNDLEGFDEKSIAILERWRALNDVMSVEHGIYMASKYREQYVARGGIKSLSRYPAYRALSRTIREEFAATANADATSGYGAEWDPAGISSQVLQEVWPDLAIMGQFPVVAMSRSPQLHAVMNTFIEAYLLDEQVDAIAGSNNLMGTRSAVTRNVTLTARKFGHNHPISSEFEEDSIVNAAAVARQSGVYAIGKAEENAAVNGQRAAITAGTGVSTFDTGITFTVTNNARDARYAWDGLRYQAGLSGLSQDASSGFTVEHLANLQGQLGRYGNPAQCFWWGGYMARAKLITLKDASNTAVILTSDKAGGPGSFRTGEVGTVLGSPLVVSYDQGQNLNAAGVDDGSAGGKTQIGLCNRTRWAYGTVRLTRVEVLRETRAEYDQILVKFTKRSILKAAVDASATDQWIGAINGVATS